jgi:CheY-like chemotaxis protein
MRLKLADTDALHDGRQAAQFAGKPGYSWRAPCDSHMKPTVLIIDDDRELSEVLAETLQLEGFETMAGDGVEAMDVLASRPRPDVIVLDYKMPRMNGEEFRARQLQDPALAGIPVIFMTASRGQVDFSGDTRLTLLPKPVSAETLIEVIRAVLDPRAN